ncbi:hypothetical protein D3C74_309000 [compost metagenome]
MNQINLIDGYGEFVASGIQNMHIITVNSADFQRPDPHIFADPVILVNDIITDLQLSVAFDPFSIIDAFGYFACLALLLGEHFSFSNDRKMYGGQFKSGAQIPLQDRRFLNPVIIQNPADPLHPFFAIGQHNDLHA